MTGQILLYLNTLGLICSNSLQKSLVLLTIVISVISVFFSLSLAENMSVQRGHLNAV